MRKPNAKQRILEVAGELFGQRGYGSVGINEIIEKSETAKASFYQHYTSKEKLCAAWLGSIHERSEASHDAILKSDRPPLEKVEQYFLALKDWLQANQYRGCPYTNTTANLPAASPPIQEKVDEHKLFLRDFFIELAREFCEGREARQLGTTLFLLYSGATAESQNLHATWPVDAAAEAAVALCREASVHSSDSPTTTFHEAPELEAKDL